MMKLSWILNLWYWMMLIWNVVTTVLGILGGVSEINAAGLVEEGKYERFHNVINREWSLKFPELNGENFPFVVPDVQIPRNKMSDFPTCYSNQFNNF